MDVERACGSATLRELELNMKKPVTAETASGLIDQRIKELEDWRGKTLAKVRQIIRGADPEIVEEWKWRGVPVWSHHGFICTGEVYKNHVKMTFPTAIDIDEGDKVDEAGLKDLICAAVALNLVGGNKAKKRRG
jgi:hypothetical protein